MNAVHSVSGGNASLLEPLLAMPGFQALARSVANGRTPALATGVIDTQKCHVAWGLSCYRETGGLILTNSELRAKEIVEDMEFFYSSEPETACSDSPSGKSATPPDVFPVRKVKYYPAKDIVFYSADVRSVSIARQRFEVLEKLLNGERLMVVASVEALFDKLCPPEALKAHILELAVGDELSMNELAARLHFMGYERAELVEGPGQFAVRGGIMDVFSSTSDNAFRLEFWGDEIDSIRLLDSYSQRSIEKMETIRLFPMRELVYGQEELDKAITAMEEEYKEAYRNLLKKELKEEADTLKDTISWALEKLKENKSIPGIDRYFNFFYSNGASLLDYLPPDALLFFDEPARIAAHGDTVLSEFHESIQNRILKGHLLPSQMDMVFSYDQILRLAGRFSQILFSAMTKTTKDFTVKEICTFYVKSLVTYNKGMELFEEDVKHWISRGSAVLILAGNKLRGERLCAWLLERGISARFAEDLKNPLEKGRVVVSRGSLSRGFEYLDSQPGVSGGNASIVLISDKELFGAERQKKRIKKKKGAKIESFTDLKIGDYVVHDNHGIGIYRGIEQIVVDEGLTKDYLKLEYADGGAIFVHTGQMDMIQKYIGEEGGRKKLNKLGGTEWHKAKAKTYKAVRILAAELVELYAKRQAAVGFEYSKDTVWQKEFEESFPFEETEDQLAAIEDVKSDMEYGKVMDRLICGDVGYGKTEVAIRAAFKTVQDGRQVAYLVPTTILAQQHYNTFSYRMKQYPINIEMLSRFRTAKEQKATLENIEKGSADIVIGTHRILSKDIKFKDLGLIIVDEEQRFGVSHKEKLKRLRESANVLTLTATPIPRTLHMSLTGIRDMSILEEPPQERQPIQTYVMEYNPEFVRDAINRELARNGQVYYLHNRVRNIPEIANKIQELVPEATVAFAHGQMSEHELENIMLEFVNGAIDVLVCTTIIETGLDIGNVNTIVIQDADYMGLSQLYQLRGRVGRSNRQAYAYLMYRRDKVLQEAAEKRLQTIREFTEFGSGFKIALRDLEIRGAGNLLGVEQHGHMELVGYDMYCKLLAEAVEEIKGEVTGAGFETVVDIPVSAFIPEYYIKNEEQKLEIYKKISLIKTLQDYNDVQEEIEDRYGDLPRSVQNLLEVALLKSVAHDIGIVSIGQKQKNIIMTFKKDSEVDPLSIASLVNENRGRMFFTAAAEPYLSYRIGDGVDRYGSREVKELRELLGKLGVR